ncbi:MAG TPA: T9SS type A sorting domain-containing protein, partial [Cytophagales bacterium]|nr:T9SS type A sorting domain-containing protein [Cytophagales bacterium]
YGTTFNEATPAVTLTTTDNGFLAAGRTDRPTFGSIDATLIKTDALGTQLWSRVYGGQGIDQFNSVKESPNSSVRYAAVGSTTSYSGNPDAYLVGTDPNGFPLFSRTYGGANIDRFNHIQKIVHPVDGPGYIMVGETNSFNHFGAGFDIYVVRTDLMGNFKASAVLGYTGDQIGNWIEPTNDGYIIAGSTTYNCTPAPTGVIHSDIYAVKLDFNLNLVWDRIVGNNQVLRNDVAYCVRVDNVGNYVFTGETQSFAAPGGNAFLLKFTPVGGAVFFRTYSGPNNDQGRSLIVHKTSTGVFYVVAGFSNSFNANAINDAMLFKTDQNGNLVWTRLYGKLRPDHAYEVDFSSTLQNGYILAGHEQSFGAGNNDAYLIRTDINGFTGPYNCVSTPNLISQFYGPCINRATKVIRVDNQRVVSTPTALIPYVQAKCVNTTAAREDDVAVGTLTQAVTLSPNPTKTQLHISILPELKGSAVSVIDLDGKNVMQFRLEEELQHISVEGLRSGLYMVVITQPDGMVIKEKLVIHD